MRKIQKKTVRQTNKTRQRKRASATRTTYRRRPRKAPDHFFAVGVVLWAFLSSFLLAMILASQFAPMDEGDATNGAYYTNITNSGDINLNVMSTPGGVIEVGKDSLNISSNATNGYKIYISTVNGATGNGLYGNGGESGVFISPASGTIVAPAALSTNTWGYRQSRKKNTEASIAISNELSEDGLGTSSLVDGVTTYTKDSAVFAAVPTYGNENVLYENNSPSVSTNSVDVYYGVNATTALPSGTYSNSIVYTAITDASNAQGNGITVNPASQSGLDAGENITVSTPFYPDDNVDLTNLGISVKIGNATCAEATPEVGNGGNLQISCTAPAQNSLGAYSVKVKIDKYNSSKTYTLTNGYEYKAGAHVRYVANEPDGAGTVSGSMDDQTITYMTSSTNDGAVDTTLLSGTTSELTLYAPNWTLAGYGFKGWNTAADGSGEMYGPNQTISTADGTLTAFGGSSGGSSSEEELTLYAQWVASSGEMANWDGCGTLDSGAVTALEYAGDTYAVAKLGDGKCWMIENMRTADNEGEASTNFTTSSYDARQYNLSNVSGTSGAYPINNTAPAGSYQASSWYQWKGYGGYYSWTSATQGVCPAGWRVPSVYGDGEDDNTASTLSDFRYLNNILNGDYGVVFTAEASNAWRKYPNNFIFSGYWSKNSSRYRGTIGRYWSSSENGSNSAYFLHIESSEMGPTGSNNRYIGQAVRCVIGG